MAQLALPVIACHLCGSSEGTYGDAPAVCRGCIVSALAKAETEAVEIRRRLARYTHDCPAEGCLTCMYA